MTSAIALYFKILSKPQKALKLSNCQKFYSFDRKDVRNSLFSQFLEAPIIFTTLKNVSWSDILLRKIRVISIPRKDSLKSTSERIKCTLIRYLLLSISLEIKILNLHNILLLEKAENILLTPSGHCKEIYSAHVKHFKTTETFSRTPPFLTIPFYLLSKFLKNKHANEERGTTVFINPPSFYIISAYHRLHPNKKLVIRFHDILSKKDIKLIERLKDSNIKPQIESYSLLDAKEQKIIYKPNGVDPYFMSSLVSTFRTSLYYFYGASSDKKSQIGNRTSALSQFNDELRHIYPKIGSWTSYKVTNSSKEYIPYIEFARQSALCEVYLDLARIKPTEGFSFRIAEALFLNRKIITNRTCIQKEPFYHPSRIFILGKDSPNRLKDFLEDEIRPLPKEILKLYDASLWWTDMDPSSLTK